MRLFSCFLLALMGCEEPEFVADSGLPEEALANAVERISSQDASDLINDGRAQLGQVTNNCKEWARSNTIASYGVNIPSTHAAQYKWVSDTVPATNVARWLGSYANGRRTLTELAANSNSVLNVSVPNGDPQVLVLYASTTSVTATLTKGASVLAVTSTGGGSGTVSATTISGSGTWTLDVRNNGASKAYSVVAVVLSRSRFVSDWETARRGDIIQMYGGTLNSARGTGGPHTTFIQTDFNANGGTTCSGAATSSVNTSGCNWLDSNWVGPNTVGAHNVTLEHMMKMVAYSSDYGFTVYRLN